MADAFRGLTIRLGADSRPLRSAIDSVRSSASQAQKQLTMMNKALRFNPGNVRALSAALDLAGDKARLNARAASLIGTAMRQAARQTVRFSEESGIAGGRMDKVAASMRQIYSQSQKIRAERTHVNADLQRMYDSMKQVVAEAYRGENAFKLNEKRVKKIEESLKKAGVQGKNSAMVADRYVKQLQNGLVGTLEEAKKARLEINRLIKSAANTQRNPLAGSFGLESSLQAGNKLVKVFGNLHRESSRLKSDLEAIKQVEGFRAMRNELIAYESAVREASYEEARLLAEHAKMSSSAGIGKMTFEMKRLDSVIEAACSDARAMDAAFSALPKSIESAKAKLIASHNATSALTKKANELRTAIREIEAANPFAKMAAQSGNVHLAFEKATREAAEMAAEMHTAEAAVERLEAEMREYANTSFIGPKRDIERVNAELEEERAKLAEVASRAHAANEALESTAAAHHLATLNRELAEVGTRLQSVNAHSSALSGLAGDMRTMGYGLYSTITPAAMMIGRYAVQSAEEVDSAYRDMRKTVNGTEEQFEHLRSAALEFGRTHVTSADQILEIEAIGGQLSIAANNLESFSEVVSNLDIATNMDTETISENLGQLSNIMKDMNQDLETGPGSLKSFSDALVRLGNNSAAQEDKIMNVMMRIASMGTISGIATPDLLALSTAVAAAGQGSEAAGTAVSKTFTQIESAVGKGGDKLEKFAEVSDMSAAEFTKAWNERPMEAFTALIEGLKRIDDEGGKVSNTLGELGVNGVRQRQTLLNLTNTIGVLNNAVVMSNDAWNGVGDHWGAAGDAAREAQRKSEGFSGQLKMMKNAAQELGVALLDGSVPMLKDMTSTLQALAAAVSGMPDFLKSMAVRAGVTAAALGPLLVAFGATVDGVKKLAAAFDAVKGAWEMRGARASKIAELDAAIEANTAAQARNAAVTRNVMSSQVASEEVKQGYIATLREEAAALEADAAALEDDRAAYESAATGAKAFKTALKGIAVAAGSMVAIEAIGAIIGAIGEMIERQQELEKATRSVREAANEFSEAMNSQAPATGVATMATEDYTTAVQSAVEGNTQLADSIKENGKAAQASASIAQSYADKIIELTDNLGGSSEKLALLQTYVAAFNQEAGTSIEIIDEKTGALNVQNDVIQKNVELLKKQAYADAAKKNAEEATRELQKQEATLDALKKKRDKLKEPHDDTPGIGYDTQEIDYAIRKTTELRDSAKEVSDAMWAAFESASSDASKAKDGLKETAGGSIETAKAINLLGDDADEASDEIEDLTDSIDVLCSFYPEFDRMFSDSGITVEGFSEMLTDMGLSMEDVAEGMKDMADAVSDGFNRIEEDSEMSLEKYLDNLRHNKDLTEQWADNLKKVYAKSDDETFRKWVRSIAEEGPKEAAVVAQMVEQDAASLEEDARLWADAAEKGPGYYLDSIDLTTEEAAKKAEEMARRAQSGLLQLGNVEVSYTVTDNGTIQLNMDELTALDLKELKKKGLIVSDDGTVKVNLRALSDLDEQTLKEKGLYVTDDGRIKRISDDLTDLGNQTATPSVEVDSSQAELAIENMRRLLSSLGHEYSIATIMGQGLTRGGHASGGIVDEVIKRIPMHADGGMAGIVNRATLTNVGWVGEAGSEAIIPLSNRRYVRPFAQAVASEMRPQGGDTTVMNVYLDGAMLAGGVSESTTLGDLAKGLRRKARR